MTEMEYCCRVQRFLLEADVCPEQDLLHRVDRAKASIAVSRCIDGDFDVGLAIAEEIAERWQLLV